MLDWLTAMYGDTHSPAIQQLVASLERLLEKPTRNAYQHWLQQYTQSITPDLIGALSLLTARLLTQTTLASTEQLYTLQSLMETLGHHSGSLEILQLLKIISEDAVGPRNINDKNKDDVLKRLYNYRGSCLAEHGHYYASIDHFNATIALDASFAPAYCNRARALLELNRYEEALLDCQNLLEVNPAYPQGQATCRLVEVLHALTRTRPGTAAELALKHGLLELLRHYDRPLKPGETLQVIDQQVNPLEMPELPPIGASADELNHFGVVQGRSGDIESAIATFTQTIIVDPSYEKAYYNRAKAYTLLGEYEKALADYQYLLKDNPDDEEVQSLLAQTQKAWQEQQGSQMIQVDASIRQEYHLEQNEYLSQADHLSRYLHEHQQALQRLQAIPYSDFIADAILPARCAILRGVIFSRQERTSEAMSCYHEAREMLANTLDHYLLLSSLEGSGRCHLHLNQLREAEPLFQKALDIATAQPYPHAQQRLYHLLGTCNEQDHQYTAAITWYQKAHEHATTLGNWGGAFAALSRLAALYAQVQQSEEHKRIEKELQEILEEQEILAYAGPNALPRPHIREQAIAALFPDGLPSTEAATNRSELFTRAAELRKNKHYREAIPLYLTTLAHSLTEDKPGNLLDSLNALGICYLRLTEEAVEKARRDFLSPDMKEDVPDSRPGRIMRTLLATPPGIYPLLFGSSIDLANRGRLCHLWCLEISKETESLADQASQVSNLAIIEETLGNLDIASHYQSWALEYHTYTGQMDSAVIDLTDLAYIELQLGDDEYANSLYQQAEEIKHVQPA